MICCVGVRGLLFKGVLSIKMTCLLLMVEIVLQSQSFHAKIILNEQGSQTRQIQLIKLKEFVTIQRTVKENCPM